MVSPNKSCKICGKGYKRIFSRSHSMQRTIKRQQVNLQWLTIGPAKRIKACTKCIKSFTAGKIKQLQPA
ncbi:MAG: hypothetical protein A3C85_02840 [Candidatus Doudnabacteria bacterium RIFCSPHIGHO2_02_FULL_48_21]|uniref:50S ribosomal protein L28 n=1 Tax=Candidatus Doudnabacteria bacterium RIFCSPLOWO2_02_FULL_48_13 TaxID=1817845 RepID=A0A1F5Q9N6_9BACT|nr:MAG: hypothetical protein A3K05_03405 [Candidatus Doudnabacteria bacterium RIFCSPHIGHO2_01_48_18]OGE79360.1 MAG: hypothetical protein A2668_02505 [Candidatus Doudnabacteria bacterium RIFCSPHIGHO2_01_FULL_48_180]OGE91344.1 MAG: hypothetical protein A3F44_03500 [Candidatus Doudnabacteria bacterium RIFCSPHIGHO2_12_FULL_47_25]OGE92889.1 MAG: hypothetical protein A3C85_02840 [Candidatus Doudnabacteria bacterium RIFCSPHIGHO2_02_FULL_48_21]OGE96678.1 MAG: hypothetical protein A3A83_01790 [Candidatu